MKLAVLIFCVITSVFSFNYIDTIYVNTYATGIKNGTTWNNAFTTLQAGYNAASAGFLILCNGKELLSAPVTLNGVSDVTFEGADANYVLNGNKIAVNCISNATANHITFRKFTYINAAADGLNLSSGGDYYIFENCISKKNFGDGWDMGNQSNYNQFINCNSDSNSGIGINNYGVGTKIVFCNISNNIGGGISTSFNDCLNITNSIVSNNGSYGIRCDGGNNIKNNVIDNNTIGIMFFSPTTSNGNFIIGNRVTNNISGIDAKSTHFAMLHNYFHKNSKTLVNTENVKINSSNQFDTGLDDGYNDGVNGDYTLKSNAVMSNLKITIGAN